MEHVVAGSSRHVNSSGATWSLRLASLYQHKPLGVVDDV